jgi:hypothetical protein
MKPHFIFALFMGIILISCTKKKHKETFIKFDNEQYEVEETQFLKQVVFGKTGFDSLALCQIPRDLGFEHLKFYLAGLKPVLDNIKEADTFLANSILKNAISVSDNDLINIYQQNFYGSITYWDKHNAGNHKTLSANNFENYKNGKIEISHPLFFGNNKYAIFEYKLQKEVTQEEAELDIYYLVNDKWIKQGTVVMMSRIKKDL